MATKEEISEKLSKVLIPGVGRSLVALGLVREIEVSPEKVRLSLASTALSSELRGLIEKEAKDKIKELEGIKEVEINFVEAKPKDINKIQHTIAVLSGKGGVGKSLVTSLLGIALNRKGYEVGILDADITGPSIPKMFGVNWRPTGSESGILPVMSRSGIEIMSINLLLPSEDDAVIWRGPLIGKAIQQFLNDVLWGKLDFLMVDLPPGTADAPLTVAQSFPLSGVIAVSTPQELAGMVVRKAVKFARQVNVSILGVVENMSYFISPESGKKLEIFGKSKGEEMAKAANAPLLGRIPIDPELARLCDEGWIERYSSEALDSLAGKFFEVISGLVPSK